MDRFRWSFLSHQYKPLCHSKSIDIKFSCYFYIFLVLHPCHCRCCLHCGLSLWNVISLFATMPFANILHYTNQHPSRRIWWKSTRALTLVCGCGGERKQRKQRNWILFTHVLETHLEKRKHLVIDITTTDSPPPSSPSASTTSLQQWQPHYKGHKRWDFYYLQNVDVHYWSDCIQFHWNGCVCSWAEINSFSVFKAGPLQRCALSLRH